MNDKKTAVGKTIFKELNDRYLSSERLFAAIFTSIMIAYIFQMMENSSFFDLNAYYSSINFTMFWFVFAVAFCLMVGVTYLTKISVIIPWAMLSSLTLLACRFSSVYSEGGVYFLIGIAFVVFVCVMWLQKDDKLKLSAIKIDYKTCLFAGIGLFVFSVLVFGYYTTLRYRSFQNATFDFGIFCQMFENMADGFAPVTTLERSVEMSHFGIHFSPIFYLLLPLYYIFRSPIYLIYAQVFVVALGIFPVYLICKRLKLSGKVTLALEIIYAFYPCLINGCFYDFHENKFLTTIILFLLYFIICNKTVMTFVFSLLLLSVKEDAAIYLIAIALFVIISRKEYIIGTIMMALAVLYFIIANEIVSSISPDGVMMWRLSDYFVNGEESYMAVFKSIFFDFGHLIKMMFTADKFPFIIWMLLPVAFVPLSSSKISSLILLLPVIPINLMQSWEYQYNIDYQYTYGVAALVIFLFIINLTKLKSNTKRIALLMAVIMSVVMFLNVVMPKVKNNSFYYSNTGEKAEKIEQMLDTIPDDATVTAGHFITPHLARIKTLYSVPDYYKDIEQTDYFVTDTRDAENEGAMLQVMGDDYELVDSSDFVNLYKHK